MKKKLGLTLVALLTAFSGIALAAQGDGANKHNGIESQNSTTFLSDSEMKDVTAGYTITVGIHNGERLWFYHDDSGKFQGHCWEGRDLKCHKDSKRRALDGDKHYALNGRP